MSDRRGSASPILQTILLLCCFSGMGNSIVKVDVRCYCNLPKCVATGHMCRSSAGVCVSERRAGQAWWWRHACIELVSTDDRQMEAPDCQKNVTRQCCTDDMCNYLGRTAFPSSGIRRTNHSSHVTGYLSNHDTSLLRGGHSSDPRPWFRATVVAVPVAGGLTLVVLIVMAAKMLRVESRRQTRLKPAETHVVYRRRKHFLPKSVSCILLGSGHSGPVVRNYASMGSLGPSGSLCHSSSVALSTDSGCTNTSKEKYFVFDV